MKKRKVTTVIKNSFKKLKYMDKTQMHYFMVMSFLIMFCLFTGGTYSYFTFSKHLNAATITIARLNYTLSSPSSDYVNGTVSVGAGETKIIELELASHNAVETKYALRYASENSNIKVYYSEEVGNNVMGTIGPTGSTITMKVIIKNTGSTAATVDFTIRGGYIQNTVETNILEGYYENDIVVRTVLFTESLTNGVINQGFPAKDAGYAYLATQCSSGVTTTWDNDAWELTIDEIGQRVACDVYFKKPTKDVEIYFVLKNNDGTVTFSEETPSQDNYTFESTLCNNGATAEWDGTAWEMNASNVTNTQTMCTGYFQQKSGGGQ